eukprot:Sdes_comp10721_c0_seq1m2406
MEEKSSKQYHQSQVSLLHDEDAHSNTGKASLPENGPNPPLESQKMGPFKSIFSITSTMLGVGMLGLPTAMANCGYVYGVILLLIAAYMSAHASYRLCSCLGNPKVRTPLIHSYADLGNHAWGSAGKIMANVCLYGSCAGAGILFLILASEQCQNVFGKNRASFPQWCAINCLLLFPFIFLKTYQSASSLSTVGVFSSITTSALITYLGSQQEGYTPSSEPPPTYSPLVNDPALLSMAFSSMVFSFGGAVAFPEILRVMREPEKNFLLV